eukprot:m.202145 g.202145  ORF g.202145 m.202145 type:complete len:83 (-) comp14976_c0_seq19:5104-5352(-)
MSCQIICPAMSVFVFVRLIRVSIMSFLHSCAAKVPCHSFIRACVFVGNEQLCVVNIMGGMGHREEEGESAMSASDAGELCVS